MPPPVVEAPHDADQLFIEAYDRLHGRLLDRAERFLDGDEARDAEAAAVADVWYRWPHLTPEQRSDRYFFRALRSRVINAFRKRRPNISLADAEDELERHAASAADADARAAEHADAVAEVLDRALRSMSPQRREVLLLIREERLTYQQAAEALGLRVGTVNRHYAMAMEHLRAAFTRAGFRIADVKPARLPSPKGGAAND